MDALRTGWITLLHGLNGSLKSGHPNDVSTPDRWVLTQVALAIHGTIAIKNRLWNRVNFRSAKECTHTFSVMLLSMNRVFMKLP